MTKANIFSKRFNDRFSSVSPPAGCHVMNVSWNDFGGGNLDGFGKVITDSLLGLIS